MNECARAIVRDLRLYLRWAEASQGRTTALVAPGSGTTERIELTELPELPGY